MDTRTTPKPERDDVYPSTRSYESVWANLIVRPFTISVVSDATPNTLARIFGLLATFDVIPVSVQSVPFGQGVLTLQLALDDIDEHRVDLLRRKLLQLTDTISVDTSDS